MCVIYFVAPVHEVRLRLLIDFSAAHWVFEIYPAKFLAIKYEQKNSLQIMQPALTLRFQNNFKNSFIC
jgi:hypothetical protein